MSEENLLMIGITAFTLAIVLALVTIGTANAAPNTRVLTYDIVCVEQGDSYCERYSVFKVVQE